MQPSWALLAIIQPVPSWELNSSRESLCSISTLGRSRGCRTPTACPLCQPLLSCSPSRKEAAASGQAAVDVCHYLVHSIGTLAAHAPSLEHRDTRYPWSRTTPSLLKPFMLRGWLPWAAAQPLPLSCGSTSSLGTPSPRRRWAHFWGLSRSSGPASTLAWTQSSRPNCFHQCLLCHLGGVSPCLRMTAACGAKPHSRCSTLPQKPVADISAGSASGPLGSLLLPRGGHSDGDTSFVLQASHMFCALPLSHEQLQHNLP